MRDEFPSWTITVSRDESAKLPLSQLFMRFMRMVGPAARALGLRVEIDNGTDKIIRQAFERACSAQCDDCRAGLAVHRDENNNWYHRLGQTARILCRAGRIRDAMVSPTVEGLTDAKSLTVTDTEGNVPVQPMLQADGGPRRV